MASDVKTPWPISDLATRRTTVLSGSTTTKAPSSGPKAASAPQGSPEVAAAATAHSGTNAATARPPAAVRAAWTTARRVKAMVMARLPQIFISSAAR